MKKLVKSSIAVLVALILLVTTCVVGFTAGAKDIASFDIISATAEKKASDMETTLDLEAGATFAVVDSTSLAKADGVPEKAYKATFTKAFDGFYIPTNGKDEAATDLAGKDKEIIFDAWIYVSDISKTNAMIVRVYPSTGRVNDSDPNKSHSKIAGYFWQGNLKTNLQVTQTGWNHVQVKMSFNNGWQSSAGYATYTLDQKIAGITFHDHGEPTGGGYDFAVAGVTLKLVEEESSAPSRIGIPAASSKEAVSSEEVSSSAAVTSAEISSVADDALYGDEGSDDAEEAGFPDWAWIVIGVVAVAAIAAVVVIVLKNNAKK
ncbi:MAG: hypothetical protein IJY56_01245 [Clostridia bacterium]|nr:hypothetical protein [Clostridia bacterium]